MEEETLTKSGNYLCGNLLYHKSNFIGAWVEISA